MKKLIISMLLVLSVISSMAISAYAIDIDEPLGSSVTTNSRYAVLD